jgi:hypothetical protein
LNRQSIVRRGLLICALLFLGWLAWQAFSGGVRQLARSRTAGQKIETAAQMACGFLSLPVVLTCFWQRRWAQVVRTIWSAALTTAAVLSALVWGPAMPLIGALFGAIALLVSQTIIWVLGICTTDDFNPPIYSIPKSGLA